MQKCTLQDTLPSTMLLNGLMFAIDEMPVEYSAQLRSYRILFRLIDAWGLMIAFTDFAYQSNVLLYKTDGFTVGKTLGIMIKIYVQLKLNLWTGNQNYLDRDVVIPSSVADLIAF